MTKHVMPLIAASALLSSASIPAAVRTGVRMDASEPKKVEELLNQVNAELKRVSDSVKQTAETALKEAKDAGKVADETKQAADKALTAQSALKDAVDKLTNRMEEISTRSTDLEQKLASRGGRSGGEQVKSLGALAVESEDYKKFVQNGCKGTARIAVQNAITSVVGSAGALILPDRDAELVGIPRRQMTIRQLLSVGRTTSNLVEYARQTTRTNAAEIVSEGTQKPESTYVWEQADAPVRTIAHFVHVSRQAMDDAVQLQSEIDDELRYGLDLVEENQILKGDGTGINLDGLVSQATAFSPAFEPEGETAIDTLRLAVLQVALAEYPADGFVLHPEDWARIELTKDSQLRYIFANVLQLAGPQLWGRRVIETAAMDAGEFLTGAFKAAAKIYDRMDAEVLISSEDRDNFIKNMLTVRAEKRLALAVKRPAALVTGELTYPSGS